MLAVGASFVLWPSREPERLVAGAREAIATHGRYAEAELRALLTEVPPPRSEPARREAGVTSNALEASINRALVERGGYATFWRVFLSSTPRCAVSPAGCRRCSSIPGCATRCRPARCRPGVSGSAARCVGWRRAGPPFAGPAGHGDSDALRRLARQIELIAGAMGRLEG